MTFFPGKIREKSKGNENLGAEGFSKIENFLDIKSEIISFNG